MTTPQPYPIRTASATAPAAPRAASTAPAIAPPARHDETTRTRWMATAHDLFPAVVAGLVAVLISYAGP